ncbi:hypothetical protein YYC_02806 [Plasmodium yoelii 17X]|uniref:PIR protein n=4 Tax=Plasmodium yoelii TaxID=5861 RepID=A0AAF0B7X1_PLAYO|nr:uncharacterized protein PY17X_1468300 [Plasmodium yoelii]ETB59966.1 hypothetical protein YYC_02806 [Plasmodium yoelii 17X]WBY61336.1 PIR protein [Plasmodium yoelii yoelii]CDS44099.1 YIR protein [Plasmodium yoelii]VTZ81990.1 PIR protein [Plasmodium yoelii]|eukprot:XP_725423.2 uncharacterized protein PY17X_1468300 [Plasmodium yoelii]
MDADICRNFLLVRNKFPDKLIDENFQFKDDTFNDYCTNKCDTDLEKISAGCLYFLNTFFGSSELFAQYSNNYMNILEYIIIWLSYMLNLIKNEKNDSLDFFYRVYINGSDKYKTPINYVESCSNYKELIDKTNMMNMDIKDISKFYDAFILLCEMYSGFDEHSPNCNKYFEDATKFVEKYKNLNGDSSITGKNSYSQLLCTLSTDYDNFKNKCKNAKCNNITSFPEIKTQTTVKCSVQGSEVTPSSSSIANNLLLVLFIFGAIGIFLGISYKYSLFGFRKRAQKQYLREKIKNIKKRINH